MSLNKGQRAELKAEKLRKKRLEKHRDKQKFEKLVQKKEFDLIDTREIRR